MSREGAAGGATEGFVRVGRVDEFSEKRGRAVRVEGEVVAVFRVGLSVFALRDACPHMGASLADGRVDGLCVECHWHHWRFDLSSGQASERSWARALPYEVRLIEGEVWLKPPPPAALADEEQEEDWSYWDASRYFKDRDGSKRAADGEESADETDGEASQDDEG